MIGRRISGTITIIVKGVIPINTLGHELTSLKPKELRSIAVKTTLYDLIETIGDEVNPGECHIISTIVRHLFESGIARFENGTAVFMHEKGWERDWLM